MVNMYSSVDTAGMQGVTMKIVRIKHLTLGTVCALHAVELRPEYHYDP